MLRTRLSWIILVALVALFVVASVDALRSPDSEGSMSAATEPPSTTTEPAVEKVVDEAGNVLPGCNRPSEVSFTGRTADGRWLGGLFLSPITPRCRPGFRYFRMTVWDAAGKRAGAWTGPLVFDRASSRVRGSIDEPFLPFHCERRGPLRALVTAGPEVAPKGEAFRIEPKCTPLMGEVVDEAGNPVPDCTAPEQLAGSFEAYQKGNWSAELLVRPVDACRQGFLYFRMTVRDKRSGRRLGVWSGRLHLFSEDVTLVADDKTYAYLDDFHCDRAGRPLVAFVTVGVDRAPRGKPVRTVAKCLDKPG